MLLPSLGYRRYFQGTGQSMCRVRQGKFGSGPWGDVRTGKGCEWLSLGSMILSGEEPSHLISFYFFLVNTILLYQVVQ